MKKQYALVTGSSKGLGRAFALELAQRGYNLILVSLPNEDLQSTIKECQLFNIECVSYELDLTRKEDLLGLVEDVNSKYEVFMLVNNAGIGGSRSFSDAPYSYIETMMSLNVVATTTLSHQLLPNLKRQERGYILNISSMASLVASGYKTIYPASKCFVRHFSLGLREELRDANIKVCVATLGPMTTSQEIADRIDSQGVFGRMLTIPIEQTARKSINALMRGDAEIVIGTFNKLMKIVIDIFPKRYVARQMTRKVKNNEIK